MAPSTRLSLRNLTRLPSAVTVPRYARAELSAGILHIGLGNFHRAHQAIYLHRLLDTGRDLDWAIIGAGIKPYDRAMRDKLQGQDWLTTVVELAPDGLQALVCGSMIDFTQVAADALIERMAHPDIRIVSLTVTEGGYYIDPKSGGFDAGHADIRAERAAPERPATVFGIVIAALARRRAAGLAPFTIMSCDNLPENGHVTRQAVLGLARLLPGDMAGWIDGHVTFPSSMVDCITPATGTREIAMVRERFGIDDAAPVVCEPFRQWVLEDSFTSGRPALEEVGVEFVGDVAPYELMKLRILNGGHAAIAYPAALLDIHYVHEAMAHPLVAGFLDRLEQEEIIPTVPRIMGVDLGDYYRTIVARFANPAVGDTIARLCLDGSNRQPKFILPTIIERAQAGLAVEGLALEVALWCRYCAGTSDSGRAIAVEDDAAVRLAACALAARDNPACWLAMTDILGNLGQHAAFAAAFSRALASLWRNGTAATLDAYAARGGVTSVAGATGHAQLARPDI